MLAHKTEKCNTVQDASYPLNISAPSLSQSCWHGRRLSVSLESWAFNSSEPVMFETKKSKPLGQRSCFRSHEHTWTAPLRFFQWRPLVSRGLIAFLEAFPHLKALKETITHCELLCHSTQNYCHLLWPSKPLSGWCLYPSLFPDSRKTTDFPPPNRSVHKSTPSPFLLGSLSTWRTLSARREPFLSWYPVLRYRSSAAQISYFPSVKLVTRCIYFADTVSEVSSKAAQFSLQ